MKLYRRLLFPFTPLYSAFMHLRNKAYDWGWCSATAFDTPTLVVGNLSLGGTGKTPHTEYLLHLLGSRFKVALLSRGYGRKTRGFRLACQADDARTLGDEPLQIHRKFPRVTVAVDAHRVRGLRLLEQMIKPDLVVLDDGFQHRRLAPGFSLLLTPFSQPYFTDFPLPAGDLRESRRGAHRADCIVVTRSPATLSERQRKRYLQAIKPAAYQRVYFSTVRYADEVCGALKAPLESLPRSLTVVTGIAHPDPLLEHLRSKGFSCRHLAFKDHHNFSDRDLQAIRSQAGGKPVLTTEKDYMRLQGSITPLYYLPIQVHILDEQAQFNRQIVNYVTSHRTDRRLPEDQD